MQASLILSATLSSNALAARQAFGSLNSADQAALEQQLAKWKALYGPIAEANGFLPEINTESVQINGHSVDELERFHNTVQDVEEAAAANPEATFSPMNQFALLTDTEFKGMLMKSFGAQNFTSAAPLPEAEIVRASEADWSTSKCNPPMANQGSCGSCWAFSTVGTVEAAHCIATGELVDLSEQQLVSCDKKSYGCDGGFPSSAIDWMQQGVCTEASYPYTSGKNGQTGSCQTSCTKKALTIGKTKTTSGENSLMTVLNSQPATVIVEAGNSVWRNYKSGVVTQCPGSQSDHAVIAVGYGTSTGDFFKIKNSWGAQWGDNGYMYLKRGVSGKGMCNVVEGISYPELGGSPAPTSNQPSPSTSKPNPSTYTPTTTKPRCTRRPRTSRKPTPTTASPNPTSSTPYTTNPLPSTSSPSPTPSSIAPPAGNGMKDQLLYQTNKIRAAHKIGPVVWDEALASKVQAFAKTCPGFKHGGPDNGLHQNLATNDPCGPGMKDSNCMKLVGASWLWYVIEEKYWNYDTNKCNGDWLKCGHFSQLMNLDNTAIGCGWSECANGNYVWCNYVSKGENTKIPRLSGMTKKELEASLTV